MKWYWKVRIYNLSGHYCHACLATEQDLSYIDTIQDFYKDLTGCKMLIEGMSDSPFESVVNLEMAFRTIWGP